MEVNRFGFASTGKKKVASLMVSDHLRRNWSLISRHID